MTVAVVQERARGRTASAWMVRSRHPTHNYERLPEKLAGMHYLVFTSLMLHNRVDAIANSA